MDFGLTDEQESLRSTVRELLTGEWPESLLKAMATADIPPPDSVWRSLARRACRV